MSIQEIAQWLQSSSLNEWIQGSLWVVPAAQTLHILGICVVLSSITMIALRLFGRLGKSWPLSEVTQHLLPWTWIALLVLLITGLTLILADPEFQLSNQVFRLKMVVLLGAVSMTVMFQIACARGAAFWHGRRFAVGVTAALWLLLWVGTAAAGRWIAYVEYG